MRFDNSWSVETKYKIYGVGHKFQHIFFIFFRCVKIGLFAHRMFWLNDTELKKWNSEKRVICKLIGEVGPKLIIVSIWSKTQANNFWYCIKLVVFIPIEYRALDMFSPIYKIRSSISPILRGCFYFLKTVILDFLGVFWH